MSRASPAVLAVLILACGVDPASPPPAPLATTEAALSSRQCPPPVPAALAPGADQELFRVLPAEGVQIYACTATGWVFESPDALLLKDGVDDDGDRVILGHHYAGPTWEYKDHSFVVGVRLAGATVDPTAIPWLLLRAGSTSATGVFSAASRIQRLQTTGGTAPATGCDATTLGAKARVPYTATYYFYRTVSGKPHPSCT